jgi:hypothetical protein
MNRTSKYRYQHDARGGNAAGLRAAPAADGRIER